MLFQKLLKISPFVILTFLNVQAISAHAREGGVSGGGGDASESRVDEIRGDIFKWISQDGAKGLTLPQGTTYETYRSSMLALLSRHAVVIGFVTTEQESSTIDPELKVSVSGQPKTCRGFNSTRDQQPHILCNTERFAATNEAEQYRLVHHEYAGLAGIEQNLRASSDYQVSNQITDFLVSETVLRLSVKKNGRGFRWSGPSGETFYECATDDPNLGINTVEYSAHQGWKDVSVGNGFTGQIVAYRSEKSSTGGLGIETLVIRRPYRVEIPASNCSQGDGNCQYVESYYSEATEEDILTFDQVRRTASIVMTRQGWEASRKDSKKSGRKPFYVALSGVCM